MNSTSIRFVRSFPSRRRTLLVLGAFCVLTAVASVIISDALSYWRLYLRLVSLEAALCVLCVWRYGLPMWKPTSAEDSDSTKAQ